MRTPSAMREFFELKMASNFEKGLSGRKPHSRNAVHIVQLCKEVEKMLDHKLLLNQDLAKQLGYLINYDPRAKLDIGQ